MDSWSLKGKLSSDGKRGRLLVFNYFNRLILVTYVIIKSVKYSKEELVPILSAGVVGY